MDPNELRKQKAALLAQAKGIQAELDATDCDLTAEQREKREARVDELIEQAEAKETEAKQIEARETQARQRTERIESLEAAGNTGRRTTAEDPERGTKPDVKVKEPEFVKDANKGFRTPREFFSQVMRANPDNPAAIKDERLKYLATAGSDEQQAGSDPYGGFLIPEGMSPNLLTVSPEMDPFAGRLTAIPMDSPTIKINARVDKTHTSSVSGGLTVSRSSETAAKTASRMQLEQIQMHANSLFGFAYATEELLRDSPRSVAALLDAGFRDEFTSTRIQELLRGTGVGEPEGVQKNPALISIAKETGQAADTILYENVIKMRARCYGYANAVWIYNHDALPQLMQMVLPIGTGGVQMWQTSAREGEPDTLLGRPAIASEYMETVGDKNDIMLINPSQILYGLYQPLESAESIHVRFDRHERAFKLWLRDDARGWWRSALTPNKSSATLSPFVTLDARA